MFRVCQCWLWVPKYGVRIASFKFRVGGELWVRINVEFKVKLRIGFKVFLKPAIAVPSKSTDVVSFLFHRILFFGTLLGTLFST